MVRWSVVTRSAIDPLEIFMSMSLRAYARHRGVALSAVQKAIATGRIHPEPDGSIDPAKADASVGTLKVDSAETRQKGL